MPGRIRNARIEDVPVLVALGARLAGESPVFRLLEFSPERTGQFLTDCLGNPDILSLVYDDGHIRGGIIAAVTQPWCFDGYASEDLAFYVDAGARHTGVGLMLIQSYREWARARGVKWVSLRTSSMIEPQQTDRVYRAMGFQPVGGDFVHMDILNGGAHG